MSKEVVLNILIIISAISMAVSSYMDSKNTTKVMIALQNGITMLQDLGVQNDAAERVIYYDLVRVEDCGYLSKLPNKERCVKSKKAHEEAVKHYELIRQNSSTSIDRYNFRVNNLVGSYDFLNRLTDLFFVLALGCNVLALYVNQRSK